METEKPEPQPEPGPEWEWMKHITTGATCWCGDTHSPRFPSI